MIAMTKYIKERLTGNIFMWPRTLLFFIFSLFFSVAPFSFAHAQSVIEDEDEEDIEVIEEDEVRPI